MEDYEARRQKYIKEWGRRLSWVSEEEVAWYTEEKDKTYPYIHSQKDLYHPELTVSIYE